MVVLCPGWDSTVPLPSCPFFYQLSPSPKLWAFLLYPGLFWLHGLSLRVLAPDSTDPSVLCTVLLLEFSREDTYHRPCILLPKSVLLYVQKELLLEVKTAGQLCVSLGDLLTVLHCFVEQNSGFQAENNPHQLFIWLRRFS
jgi:hypothetical protein